MGAYERKLLPIMWLIYFGDESWCHIVCCCGEFGLCLMIGDGGCTCDCVLLLVGYFGGDSVGSVRGVRL